MSQEFIPGPQPNIIIHRIEGDLSYEAMTADEQLGLNKGKPVYVLLDVSALALGLPEDFLSGARRSYFTNPNLGHMALYTKSPMLSSVGKMVAKLTRRQDKLSVHTDYQAALDHLLKLAKKD